MTSYAPIILDTALKHFLFSCNVFPSSLYAVHDNQADFRFHCRCKQSMNLDMQSRSLNACNDFGILATGQVSATLF